MVFSLQTLNSYKYLVQKEEFPKEKNRQKSGLSEAVATLYEWKQKHNKKKKMQFLLAKQAKPNSKFREFENENKKQQQKKKNPEKFISPLATV